MANIPAMLLRHTCTVETLEGVTGRSSQVFGAAVSFKCFVESRTRRVRSQQTGNETTSSTTVYARRDAAHGPASFAVGSRVTLPSGRVAEVIELADRDGGGLATPDHLEIILT